MPPKFESAVNVEFRIAEPPLAVATIVPIFSSAVNVEPTIAFDAADVPPAMAVIPDDATLARSLAVVIDPLFAANTLFSIALPPLSTGHKCYRCRPEKR